jgi:hypothetical protein
MTVDEFKANLLHLPVEAITRDVLLGGEAMHVPETDRLYINQRLTETFGIPADDSQVWIVGSAKLGFSITEKRLRDGTILPRYRSYRPESDIDVAVVSPRIFTAIWNDLSRYAYATARRLPWDSGVLGDYMVHGWLRPDHFPRARLRRCDDWWDLFRSLSTEVKFGRHSVRGGLFYTLENLVQYQSRAVQECRQALELVA